MAPSTVIGGKAPKQQPAPRENEPRERTKGYVKPFTREEDAALWILRGEGYGWEEINRRLGGERMGDHIRHQHSKLEKAVRARLQGGSAPRAQREERVERDEPRSVGEAAAANGVAEAAAATGAADEQYCFCGTGRHLLSSELPFAGAWVLCEECYTWCHGECTGHSPEEAEGVDDYVCPRCKPTTRSTPQTGEVGLL